MRSMDFTSDGARLVTCGNQHVKFWKMPDGFSGGASTKDGRGFGRGSDPNSMPGESKHAGSLRQERGGGGVGGQGGETAAAPTPSALEGWPAVIVGELEGDVFVDVACWNGGDGGERNGGGAGGGEEGRVFCVTAGGFLCSFSR